MRTPSSRSRPCCAAVVPHVHLRNTLRLLQLMCSPRREPGASHKQLHILHSHRLSAGAAPVFVAAQMDPRQTLRFGPPHQLAVHVAKPLLCKVYLHFGVQLMRSAWHGMEVMQEQLPALPGPGLQASAAPALPSCREPADSAV